MPDPVNPTLQWKAYIRAKLAPLSLSSEREEEIVEELAQHLQADYERELQASEDPVTARKQVLRRFADWTLLESELASLRLPRLKTGPEPDPSSLGDLLAEFRFALRRFSRRPLLAASLLLTLALGIGSNATVFSTVRATLYAPLNHPEPERLVYVWATNPERGVSRFSVNPIDFEDWRSRTDSFDSLALYRYGRGSLLGRERSESVRYALITPSFFRVLRAEPVVGRIPTRDENADGQGNVAVISNGLWRRQFGARDDIIGQTFSLDGETLRVIGVMPVGFDFLLSDVDLWKPFGSAPTYNTTRGNYYTRAVGRLKDGVTLEQAQQEMDGVTAALAAEFPRTNQGMGAFVEPLLDLYTRPIRSTMLLLWGAVGLMMVLVSVNVANLLLVQADGRAREIAIQASLGASRTRIIRQVLAEGLLIAGGGGVLGLTAAWWGVQVLGNLAAGSIPRVDQSHLDWTVALYALAIAIVVGMAAGLAPALAASRFNLPASLMNRRASGGGRRWRWIRSGLVVAQVALAVIVLSGTGLLLRSFRAVLSQDPGFRVDHLLAFTVEPDRRVHFAGDPEAFQRDRAAERTEMGRRFGVVMDEIRRLPGVSAVAAVNLKPLQGGGMMQLLDVVDRPQLDPLPAIQQRVVTPGYFELMGIPLRQGRLLNERDRYGSPRVCVISESLARKHWPDGNAVGGRLTMEGREYPETILTVVGVVGDVRPGSLEGDPGEHLYVTFDQARKGFIDNWKMDILVRAVQDPMDLMPVIRQKLLEAEPRWPPFAETSMARELDATLGQRRFLLNLLLGFSAALVLLAAVGLNAVVAHSVSQQTRDIGIRMAVGAERWQIGVLYVKKSLVLAALGLCFGIPATLAVAAVVESMLYGVGTDDPVTLLSVTLAVLGMAVLAGALPAVRASRVDPSLAIRTE